VVTCANRRRRCAGERPLRGGRCARARDRADADLLRRTAGWLRTERARDAGLADGPDRRAVAALLDLLAAELPHLDAAVRRQAVESCRRVLDDAR
jgi:hypothetical protein